MHLDDIQAMKALDPEDMLGAITAFPEQCRQAWQMVQQLSLPSSLRHAQQIAVVGMGGSAIGGDLMAALVRSRLKVPVQVIRNYTLPVWVNENTLVFASSYSGNTEETLSAFRAAHEGGAKLLAATTDGQLAHLAAKWHVPVLLMPTIGAPRAALGFSLFFLLGALHQLGYVNIDEAEVKDAFRVLDDWNLKLRPEVPTEANRAKRLAMALQGRMPIVYGAGLTVPVARRWKGEFNENGKTWSNFEALPEMNHNAVVGSEYPLDIAGHLAAICLRTPDDHPRVSLRWELTMAILRGRGVAVHEINATGQSALAQALGLVHMGDFTSVYMAFLNGKDPNEIDAIKSLKEQLAHMR